EGDYRRGERAGGTAPSRGGPPVRPRAGAPLRRRRGCPGPPPLPLPAPDTPPGALPAARLLPRLAGAPRQGRTGTIPPSPATGRRQRLSVPRPAPCCAERTCPRGTAP